LPEKSQILLFFAILSLFQASTHHKRSIIEEKRGEWERINVMIIPEGAGDYAFSSIFARNLQENND